MHSWRKCCSRWTFFSWERNIIIMRYMAIHVCHFFFNRVYNKPTTNLWKSYLHTWIMSHYYSQDLLLILTRINRHHISINNSDGSPSGSWHKVTCDLEKNNHSITASVSWYHSNLNCAWSSGKYPQPSHRSFCGLNPPTTISSITTLQLKAKYEIQNPSTCRKTLFCCIFGPMFHIFHLAWSTFCMTKTFVWLEESCCKK